MPCIFHKEEQTSIETRRPDLRPRFIKDAQPLERYSRAGSQVPPVTKALRWSKENLLYTHDLLPHCLVRRSLFTSHLTTIRRVRRWSKQNKLFTFVYAYKAFEYQMNRDLAQSVSLIFSNIHCTLHTCTVHSSIDLIWSNSSGRQLRPVHWRQIQVFKYMKCPQIVRKIHQGDFPWSEYFSKWILRVVTVSRSWLHFVKESDCFEDRPQQ